MHAGGFVIAICGFVVSLSAPAFGQRAAETSSREQSTPNADPLKVLVGRLDLERYKATIKGLTQFGDRQQGTDRNRAALDWIEAQLKSSGCTNIERTRYVYNAPAPPPQRSAGATQAAAISSGEVRKGAGGSRLRGLI